MAYFKVALVIEDSDDESEADIQQEVYTLLVSRFIVYLESLGVEKVISEEKEENAN